MPHSLTLYHFTARRFLPGIRRDGLTRGFVPLSIDPPEVLPGYPWLTTNGDWNQEWAEGTGRLPYKRNEVRITFAIPDESRCYVLHWLFHGPSMTPAFGELSAFGDPQNWRLYDGTVPAAWIRAVDFNPALVGV